MMERPFDCSECQKEPTICYSIVVNGAVTRIHMCPQCPFLEEKLFGSLQQEAHTIQKQTSLACAHCNTTLEQIRSGSPTGCAECYRIFSEMISDDLLRNQQVSQKVFSIKNDQSFHLGRSPGDTHTLSPSLRLIALNEALDETLIREDYEQAAILRDQIKELKSQCDHEKPPL